MASPTPGPLFEYTWPEPSGVFPDMKCVVCGAVGTDRVDVVKSYIGWESSMTCTYCGSVDYLADPFTGLHRVKTSSGRTWTYHPDAYEETLGQAWTHVSDREPSKSKPRQRRPRWPWRNEEEVTA